MKKHPRRRQTSSIASLLPIFSVAEALTSKSTPAKIREMFRDFVNDDMVWRMLGELAHLQQKSRQLAVNVQNRLKGLGR